MFKETIEFIKDLYKTDEFIPLHAPLFIGNEKEYLNKCIDSTFVSSVGEYVNKFEALICDYTKAKYAIATTNGTSALHISLILVGVEKDTEVLTQALTFVATTNAISYTQAEPVFIDSAVNNLGMCPLSLRSFLEEHAQKHEKYSINKKTGRRFSACVPMHVFGNPVDIDEIKKVCDEFKIPLIEDAAESLGSFYKGKHTGLVGDVATLSFNGNKIITCGGGGMVITNNEVLAKRAKHLTTTAKIPHPWEFYHDEVGYNYRLPNLNAALACAQMEQLNNFLLNKRQTAQLYKEFFLKKGLVFLDESPNCQSNFWLNAIVLKDKNERDLFLKETNDQKVMTRPLWQLMHQLPAFKHCQKTTLVNAQRFSDTVVNLPSSVRVKQ